MHRRVHVYLDESGDLGRSPRSSRHIVAAALSTPDPIGLRRLVRKANRRFGPREKHLGELKFNEASEDLRRFVLEGICATDAWIAWVAACKHPLPWPRSADNELLMTSAFEEVVGRLGATVAARTVTVVVDRRRVREKARGEFDRRITEAITRSHRGLFPPGIDVIHLDSQRSAGLQAVDFVAGAVFQSVERRRNGCLDILAPRVVAGRVV